VRSTHKEYIYAELDTLLQTKHIKIYEWCSIRHFSAISTFAHDNSHWILFPALPP